MVSIRKHPKKPGVWGVWRRGKVAAVIVKERGLFVFQSIIPAEKWTFTDERQAMDFAREFYRSPQSF